MTQRDDAHRDRADELDRAIDALMRGDHSGLDDLPPELAASVDRLLWLSGESGQESERFGTTTRSEHASKAGRNPISGSVSPEVPVRPLVAPVSKRTMKGSAGAAPVGEKSVQAHGETRKSPWPSFMRLAAVLVMLMVAGGALYALVPMLDEPDSDRHGSAPTESHNLQQLLPGRCSTEPVDRREVLALLRDVDVERDEALRRATLLKPIDVLDVDTEGLNHTFVVWQACRKFGYTYEAMALQSPYFLRKDFYGESQLDFRGPVETAYSDATLNEMLDRREELDATSRHYWETAGYVPDAALTLVLGGEVFADEERSFVAIRAMTFDAEGDSWKDTPTIVVFQLVAGEYKLFDIQSTPIGTPPYL